MTNEKIQVIRHVRNERSGSRDVVLNRLPDFKYVREGKLLLAEDCGFYDCYEYKEPVCNCRAFAGRIFNIPMLDGSNVRATGQWWDRTHPKYKELDCVSYGYNTIDELKRCFVFNGGVCFDRRLLDTCRGEPIEYWELDKMLRKQKASEGGS